MPNEATGIEARQGQPEIGIPVEANDSPLNRLVIPAKGPDRAFAHTGVDDAPSVVASSLRTHRVQRPGMGSLGAARQARTNGR